MMIRLHEVPGRAGAAASIRTRAPEPLRVLIVAPPRDVARLRAHLSAGGFTSASWIEVNRIADAWPALGEGGVDAALVALPADDPDFMLAFTRLQAATPDVPFVVMVERGREPDGLEALRHGAQEYLVREGLDAANLARALRSAAARHRHLALLRELSFTDPLTGLHNRRGFRMLAEAHLHLMGRTGRSVTLLYADVDALKEINDRHGHDEGDRVLVRVARTLRGTLRRSDLVARFGGDEFVALLLDVTPEGVAATLQRLEEALDEDERGPARRITLSIGQARLGPGGGLDLSALLAEADRDLYAARRRRGRGPVRAGVARLGAFASAARRAAMQQEPARELVRVVRRRA